MDLSVEVIRVRNLSDMPEYVEADAIIDALLGIGVKGKVRDIYAKAIECINKSKGVKISIDIPSGLDPDSGEVLGVAVKADITVTLHKPKVGFTKNPHYVGKLMVLNIGIPPEAELYVGPGDVVYRFKPRALKAHKGQAGRVLIIGGSEVFTGAPALTALTVLRTGSDLAYVAVPARAADIVASYSPNLITIKLSSSDHLIPKHLEVLKPWIDKSNVIVIGPGLGLSPESAEAFREIITYAHSLGKYVVVDADGLKHLAKYRELANTKMVLTPHSGEFKILTGMDLPDIEYLRERGEMVKKASKELNNATILLKGPVDIISNGIRVRYNKTGVPAMAVGGTGDVLSGIIASLIAKGIDPFNAACMAAFINGLAGALAFKELGEGITATDLIDRIPQIIKDPMKAFKEGLIYKRLRIVK